MTDKVARFDKHGTERDYTPGTHMLGDHIWVIVNTGRQCRPGNTRPGQTANLIEAIAQAMDLVGAGIAAVRPRAASAAVAPAGHRDRGAGLKPDPDRIREIPLPMNPVQTHHGSGESRPPSSQLDSDFWRSEHNRVDNHWDRCEVVRRAATHLASLVRRDPREVIEAHKRAKTTKDPSVEEQVLVEGHGHDITRVAEHFRLTIRQVAVIRSQAKPPRHPLTGKPWTPPTDNRLAAEEARSMKAAGLASTDIGFALGRSPNTVRAWTTSTRRAA